MTAMSVRALCLALAVVVLAACDPVPSDAEKDYVRGFCAATTRFSSGLLGESVSVATAEVVAGYAEELRQLDVPGSVAGFHERYLAYIEEALREPAGQARGDPPTPAGDTGRRLEAAARQLDECDGERFFRGG